MISPETILHKYYNFDSPEISLIKSGVENENYLVSFKGKRYVFRIYNQDHSIRGDRSLESINTELKFIENSIKVGINAPKVIKNNLNNLVTSLTIDGKTRFVVLFIFLEGKSLNKYSAKSAIEVGRVVNKFFSLGKLFENGQSKLINNILTRSSKMYLKAQNAGLFIPSAIQELQKKIELQKKLISFKQLSTGLVHGDIKLENMLFDDDELLVAVLDFDDFRHSYLLEEATMSIMHNLHSVEENLLRSGFFDNFYSQLTDSVLRQELKNLKFFLRSRFVYDIAKYLDSHKYKLVEDLLKDQEINKHILS